MQTRSVTVEIPIPRITIEIACWAFVALAIAADAMTTQIGLANGLSESNPAARGALAHGAAGFLALKAAAVGVAVTARYPVPQSERWIPPACLAAVWLGAAVWNAALLMGVIA